MARSGAVGVPSRRVLVRNRVIVAIALSSMLASYNAAADESAAVAEAREAIAAFVRAVASADVDGLKAILAPEFQLLRATGVGCGPRGNIASGLPRIKEWQVEDLVATASDELLVARYELFVVDETIEGVPVARRAPRLTVFRLLVIWRQLNHPSAVSAPIR